ncbi:MAG: NADH-quinone oxidoreductase subunit M [Verrucomicrobia bacterium]|nr:MAG: NADH-quinone oxidoreductase subunit M [Verrucomicrobiota bacterium]TAE89180.1 MAG: NADH-quinone oxidoreductase subunit M [Verrucomicrobiota bacterium]TAF27944.1 MAG: NADH-quinone oxidoreductase subunit M [Verrucomicrobiota bacterium]TAF42793.1 MAG: NADH-quinone oxidoreductase subunit M [Verrucomicrobiota bacterium]
MLALLVILPLIAFIAILAGAPARKSAVAAGLANLALGLWAAATWENSDHWSISLPVLEKPALHLAFAFTDGMSVIMVLLSVLVTLAALLSGKAPEGRETLYYGSSLLISAGAIGAFAATDLFFFYAFHELALIPTFVMIGLLGRGDRRDAAWKITLYLGFGSIILLAGLVWLANLAGTFDIPTMVRAAQEGSLSIDPATQKSIAALLIVGFGVLVSLFPFHSWAAPAYASAPAPTAMLHAGVLKKFGLYGLLRVALPILPDGMNAWLIPLLVLLVGNILWVGLVTISQKRLDLMLGNSSVMHMGYIFLAIAALASATATGQSNPLAQPAAVLLMFAHGISIAMLFGLADRIERNTGTLELSDLGGLAKSAPGLAFLFGMVAMASIGLPGLANFAGEVLVFLSAFKNYDPAAGLAPVQVAGILAIWGVVISAVYMLRAYRRVFHGPSVPSTENASDLSFADRLPVLLLAVPLLVVGIYPNLLLSLLK